MLNVNINIAGDKELLKKLEKLDNSFGNWTPELKIIGEYLKDFYSIGVFETQGGIFHARWAALNPYYELKKRKEFPGRGILVRTGTLQESYRYEVAPTFVQLENPVDYAKYHQTGTSRMPQRLLVKVDNKAKEDIVNIFKEGIIDRLSKL